jgi:hypothetical protein
LPSDVVFIPLADFLNSPHPSLKYAIQFLLIQTPENVSEGIKELVLVSHLDLFEFVFDCRKPVEVTEGQIG